MSCNVRLSCKPTSQARAAETKWELDAPIAGGTLPPAIVLTASTSHPPHTQARAAETKRELDALRRRGVDDSDVKLRLMQQGAAGGGGAAVGKPCT